MDEPKDKEFILNPWWDDNDGLEVTRFNNDFVVAVLGNHLLTDKIEQDIYAGLLKIGCYAYDDVGEYVHTIIHFGT